MLCCAQGVLQAHEITHVEAAQHKPACILQLMSRCVYAVKGLDGRWVGGWVRGAGSTTAHDRLHRASSTAAQRRCVSCPVRSARVALDVEIKQLQDALGGCERILRNPIPLSCECCDGQGGGQHGVMWLGQERTCCTCHARRVSPSGSWCGAPADTRHTARFLVLWLFLLPLALWAKMGWGVVPATLVISWLLFGIDEIAIQMEEPFGILPLELLCDGLQRNVKEMLDSEGATQVRSMCLTAPDAA